MTETTTQHRESGCRCAEMATILTSSNGKWGLMRLVPGTEFARLNGPIEFRNTSTGNIVEFYQNGTRVALMDSVGKLWANCVVTLSAAGASAGAGLLCEVRVETGAGKIWFNVDGSTTRKHVTFTRLSPFKCTPMANLSDNGNYCVLVESDGNGTGSFRVDKGSGEVLMNILGYEITINNRMEHGGFISIENTASTDDVRHVLNGGGSTLARVAGSGDVDLGVGAVVIPSGTGTPTGGDEGDIYLQANGGSSTWKFWAWRSGTWYGIVLN
jgi:hypothetical protein